MDRQLIIETYGVELKSQYALTAEVGETYHEWLCRMDISDLIDLIGADFESVDEDNDFHDADDQSDYE